MLRQVENVFRLGVKELYSLASDPVLVIFILYTFSIAIYSVAKGVRTEVNNASIAIVDEDGSELSRRLHGAFLKPYFQTPDVIGLDEVDRAMDLGRYTFVLDIPPDFQSDVLAGRKPTIQLNVDATAMTLAGNGAAYVQNIVNREVMNFERRTEARTELPVTLTVRTEFNPNLESSRFMSLMQIINNITMLALILAGAAVIREREHGTIEHLLVMPLRPAEIMLAKVWANGLVIVAAAALSLRVVVEGLLDVPINGSPALFAFGTSVYLFAVTALGIVLATIARSMPQFGLLCIPVFVVMHLLSGGLTPMESMPESLQIIMQGVPSTHFIRFSQGVLHRGADITIVWRDLAAIAGIGVLLFAYALARFRTTMSSAG